MASLAWSDSRSESLASRDQVVAKCPLFGSNFVLKDASLNFAKLCQCPLSGGERRSLLGGWFYINSMLKSIGAFVCVRSREVVRFWEGPLREAPLYIRVIIP